MHVWLMQKRCGHQTYDTALVRVNISHNSSLRSRGRDRDVSSSAVMELEQLDPGRRSLTRTRNMIDGAETPGRPLATGKVASH